MPDPEQTIRTLFDRVAAKDLSGVSQLFAKDAVFTDAAGPTVVEGRQAITDMVAEMWAGLPDVYVDVRALVADGSTVMAEIELVGSHEGSFLGCAPTGKTIRWPGAVRYELSATGDEIVSESFFYDSPGLMNQLERG